MENPSLTTIPSHAVIPGGGGTDFAGESGISATGRPPDVVSFDGLQDSSESSGSPISKDLQQANKSGRRFSDPMNIPDGSELQGMMETKSGEGEEQTVRQRSTGHAALFKDKLMGAKSELPEIWFSDRVHDAIIAKLDKSMIVRLLGKPIGYRALWNRIQALLTPSGEISLIELDNEYYLVQFASEANFQKVLSRGLYIAATIGEVVRVDYNTTEGKCGRFARLAIIVDLKKPLLSGIIIDRKRQDIEYEGLPSICFKCGKYGQMKESCGIPEVVMDTVHNEVEQRNLMELYGPWMQVVNKRRRNSSNPSTSRVVDRNTRNTERLGSRFVALAEEHDSIIEVEDDLVRVAATDTEVVNQGVRPRIVQEKLGVTNLGNNVWIVLQPNKLTVGSAGHKSSNGAESVDGLITANGGSVSMSNGQLEELTVAAKGKVVVAVSELSNDKHKAVVVVDGDGGHMNTRAKGRVLPASIRGSKVKAGNKLKLGTHSGNNLKLGAQSGGMKDPKSRKNGGARQRTTVVDRLSPLVRELDDAALTETLRLNQPRNESDMEALGLQWRSNSVFEQLSETDMQKQCPDIVAIMEPRISEMASDNFIKHSGFDCSFRVEAQGFSGGIWLLWHSVVQFEVLAISNQFVHVLCSSYTGEARFYGSFMYANLQIRERRELWAKLLAVGPGVNVPLVVGGDLNVICDPSERMGGSLRRNEICSRFIEFMFDYGLVDMGFHGPKFTWRMGSLFQRLDWCLCNVAWYSMFPSSEVHHLLRLGSGHRPIMIETVGDSLTKGNRPYRYITAWNDHLEFSEFLKSVWDENMDFSHNVAQFQKASRKWSIEVFGHIGKRKAQLMARLRGIDKALCASFHPSLARLEEQLKKELDEVLVQEEKLWHQRSRATWIA
ncbi:hypothetical protein GQ457_06G016350 [Hibiscus cannabinus]